MSPIIVSAIGMIVAVVLPTEDLTGAEMRRLQGNWTPVSVTDDGKALTAEEIRTWKVTIEASRLTVTRVADLREYVRHSSLDIDPSTTPKAINAKLTTTGEIARGIYKFENSLLILCVNKPGRGRPTAFESKPNSGTILASYKRNDRSPARTKEVPVLKPVASLKTTAQLRCFAVSPDSKLLAAGVNTFTAQGSHVEIWDLNKKERRSIHRLHEDDGYIYCLKFSPDGKQLACGTREGVRFMDWDTGKSVGELTTPEVHVGAVLDLAFTPDGKRVAAVYGGYWTDARLWDIAERKVLFYYTRTFGQSNLCGVAISPDGQTLALIGNKLTLWDMARSKSRATQEDSDYHYGQGTCVAFSPDGKWLLSGGLDGKFEIKFADLKQGGATHHLANFSSMEEYLVRAVAACPHGKSLACAGNRVDYDAGTIFGEINVLDERFMRVWVEIRHPGRMIGMAYSPDGKMLISGSFGGELRIWSVAEILEHK